MQIAIYTYIVINFLFVLYSIFYEYDKEESGFKALIEEHGVYSSIMFIIVCTLIPVILSSWVYELYKVLVGDDIFYTNKPREVKNAIEEVEEFGSYRHRLMLNLKLRILKKDGNFKISNFTEIVEIDEKGKKYNYVYGVGEGAAITNLAYSHSLAMNTIEGEFYFEGRQLKYRNTPSMRTCLGASFLKK